jgi:hypothetical protein
MCEGLGGKLSEPMIELHYFSLPLILKEGKMMPGKMSEPG